MQFPDAVKTCFNKYVVVQGRASRSEYWWWGLAVVGVSIALSIISSMLFPSTDITTTNAVTGQIITSHQPNMMLSNLWSLAVLLPSICVGVRRLHDINKSGWWMLLGFIPLIGSIILIIWFCKRGDALPNTYGTSPMENIAAAIGA